MIKSIAEEAPRGVQQTLFLSHGGPYYQRPGPGPGPGPRAPGSRPAPELRLASTPPRLVPLALATLAAACSGSDSSAGEGNAQSSDGFVVESPAADARGGPAPEASPPSPLEDVTFRVSEPCGGGLILSVQPWPAGGVQVAVLPAGPPPVLASGGEPLETVSTPIPEDEGLVFLVVVPSADGALHEGRVQAARTTLDALPESRRVAVFRAGELFADLSRDRAHLHTRLDALGPGATIAPDLVALRELLDLVQGPYGPVRRSLVVVEEEVSWSPPGEVEPIRLATCPPAPGPLEVQFPEPCAVTPPSALEYVSQLPCDAEAAAEDDFPFGEDVYLTFTEAEEAVYDEYHAAKSKSEFTLHVQLGDRDPIPAKANFRGQTSIDCSRKSMSVNLSGSTARRLGPRSADDEFYLISLCKDSGYFNQALADRLLREEGLFPLEFRFVRLYVQGEAAGVYFLLEKPAEALHRDLLALDAVIRRRFDPEDKPEDVKWPHDTEGAAWALAQYEGLMALPEELEGAALDAALAERMDIDGYARWVAFHSYLRNGDWVDEALFYASREGQGWYWRPLGWDPDDLDSDCHHGGKHALEDPHGLLYCAEGDLDYAFLHSEQVYARFATALRELMVETLPPATLATRLDEVQGELFALLDDPATCLAMKELKLGDEATCEAVQVKIEGQMDDFLAAIEARRTTLLEKLDVWEAGR